MPVFETERLLLREFAPSDWDALNAIVTEPAVTRYTHFGGWDERKRRAWLALMIAEAPIPYRNHWAITLRGSGRLIGWLFIGCPADEVMQGTRGCGYALDPRYWGQGYMPEALRAAIAYEFAAQGAQRIVAECDTENAASARVMQKAGMTFVGRFYDADFEGTWAERDHYEISAPATGG
ncbi:MAG TPA: GNAT family N-acetyltransferase [Ktedonobacterales bacterium]|nr:GNAT family N-acetyltransferase [Ktedonobacterales bacterium]